MPVQTEFGRSIAAVIEKEFAAGEGIRLIDIEEPASASYIKVTFQTDDRRVQFKIGPEHTQTESDIRSAVQRHIAFSRRKRKTRS